MRWVNRINGADFQTSPCRVVVALPECNKDGLSGTKAEAPAGAGNRFRRRGGRQPRRTGGRVRPPSQLVSLSRTPKLAQRAVETRVGSPRYVQAGPLRNVDRRLRHWHVPADVGA